MEGREGREPLSRDDPRHQEALEKVGEIMAKFFDPKRTDGGFALRSIVSLTGLTSAPALQPLNGRMAVVVEELDATGRMTVTFSGVLGPREPGDIRRLLRVRPKNCRRIPTEMAHCTLKLRMRDGGRPRAVRDFASEAAEFKSDTEGMAWLGLFNSKGNTMPEDLDAIGSLERAGIQVKLGAFLSRGEASRLARTTWARAVRRDIEQREGTIGFMQKLRDMPGEQDNFKVFQAYLESVLARGCPTIAMKQTCEFMSVCTEEVRAGELSRREVVDGALKSVCTLAREWAAFGVVAYFFFGFLQVVFDAAARPRIYIGNETESGAWQALVAILLAQGGAGGDPMGCIMALGAARGLIVSMQDPYDFGAAGGLAAAHAILTCHGAPPELINEARHLAASIYSTGFQPILPFRGVRTFSNVDDGAMARKLDFFRRFEAGELTVAYTDEWSRLVNTPSSESEPATDEDGSTDEEDGESEED